MESACLLERVKECLRQEMQSGGSWEEKLCVECHEEWD